MTDLTVNQVYAIGAPIVLAMIFAEILVSNWQNKHYYKASDSLCTLGLLAGNIAMAFAIKGFALAFHFYLYQYRLIDLTNLIPTWAVWAITFVMIDFVFYIYHRMSHRVRFLWAIHMSHHSSEEMNFAVAAPLVRPRSSAGTLSTSASITFVATIKVIKESNGGCQS